MKQFHPTYDFDLHRNYHDVVDRLIQCNSLINALQDQLASKEEQIKNLEGKLVEMSIELASSKALEDEHQLLKRQMRRIYNNQGRFDAESRPPTQVDKKRQGAAPQAPDLLATDYAPPLGSDRTGTGASTSTVNARTSRKPRPALSQSWSIRGGKASPRSSLLADAGRESAQSVPQGINGQLRPSVAGGDSTAELGRPGSLLSRQESFASRRLSDLTQYLLGMGRNDAVKVTLTKGDGAIDVSQHHQRRQGRRSSSSPQSSSGSLISAVVFPVSSRDVLAGCIDGKAWKNNANEEWPEF